MSIQSELLALKDADGLIICERVHAWAKANPQSDLHASINWDQPSAAYQHQLWQIRRLVAIHVVSDTGERQVVSLSVDRVREGGGYRSFDDVLPDRALREVLLEDALTELERVQAKYGRVQELAKVWAEAEQVKTSRRRRKTGETSQVAAGKA